MQRYKCNTKEKNIFVGRTRGRRLEDSAQLSKRFVDLIYLYTFFLRLGYWFQVKDLYDHISINWLNIVYLDAITGPLKLI